MDDKMFELMTKMYVEMQEGFKRIDTEMQDTRKELNEKLDKKADKTDITRLEIELGEKIVALFDAREVQK